MTRLITLSSLIVIAVLVMSLLATINPATPASAQQQAGSIPSGDRAARNWEYANHNSWSTNYSPQKEINKDNVKYLELKWLFPNPPASTFLASQKGAILGEGSISPALIVDGIVYHLTNMRNVYAFDGVTGKTKWTNLWEFDYDKNKAEQAARGLAGVCDTNNSGHFHAMHYINGVLYPGPIPGWFTGIDANTGKEVWRVGNICADIEGNIYKWPGEEGPGRCGLAGHPPVVYRKENIALIGMCGSDGLGGGRPFVDGYDLSVSPPKRLWRTYMAPPAPQGDSEWAIKACNNAKSGWYFSYKAWYESQGKVMGINCKDVPRENVLNDWGVPKFWGNAPSVFWGQWAVDEETGLVYLGTGNAGGTGNNNASFWSPGPHLFAATTLALDAKTGQIVWWNQHGVREMIEHDNSWNVVLANIAGRKTVIKHNVVGLIWAMDAATGEPVWVWEPSILRSRTDPDGVVRGRSGCTPRVGADPATQDGMWNDIRSKYDMQDKKWFNYPSTTATYCWIPVRPGESDIALDTDMNTIFVQIGLGTDVVLKATKCDTRADPCRAPGPFTAPFTSPQNVTVYAVDATTGKEKWRFFIPDASVRGGTIVSGGVVYVNSATGYYYALDAATGKVLNKIFLGAAVVTQGTMGKTAEGKSILLLKSGGNALLLRLLGGAASGQIPGSLIVYGLPDKVPQPAEVAREALKEIPKEQLKEVLKDVPKDVISQVAPTAETISPISYGIVGVGIVLIVISGILFTRRKKT
ncbi:MAG: hypothetical protein FJ358_03105 [Thaumarchaeota archaeon]|nr:hypothetical protein [Nitrososphaerota archaeon]